MWGYLIALLSGLLMSVQGVMNTGVTKQTSIWVSAGFVQLSAFVICVIAWLVTGRESIAQITQHVWKRCWTKLIKVVVFAGLIG